VKLNLTLCLTKHHDMKMYWGVEVELHTFLNSGLDGGEWSASLLGRFNPPGERTTGAHWIGGCVGPRTSLDAVGEKKILIPCPESNPGRPARSLLAIPTELSRLSNYEMTW
jgi:hypothetical protein